MAIKVSTGAAKYLHVTGSLSKAFTGGELRIYSGAAPSASGSYATADMAESGTLLATIRNNAAASPATVKQKIRFTPVTAGTTGTWSIVLNDKTYTFTDDASPTVAEVCTGLYRLINTGQGTTSKYFTNSTDGAITAGGRINDPDTYQLFTLTDNTTSLDIEAATAGIPFSYSSSATGAGNSITETITQADAFGLHFEAAGDVTAGTLEKLASQTWSGRAVADGTPGYFRLVQAGDAGGSSTTAIRLQGTVSSVAGADMVLRHATIYTDDLVDLSTAEFTIALT